MSIPTAIGRSSGLRLRWRCDLSSPPDRRPKTTPGSVLALPGGVGN